MQNIIFCDVDGTLFRKQLQDYFFYIRQHYSRNRLAYFFWLLLFALKVPLMLFVDHFIDRRLANKLFYQNYRGIKSGWYKDFIPQMIKDFAIPSINKNVLLYIEGYDFRKTDLYLLSGNDIQIIRQIPLNMPVKEAIGSELLINKGQLLSGKIKESRVGQNKKNLVLDILRNYPRDVHIVVLTDHHSDLPLLELAHEKIVVNPSKKLRKMANENKWKIIE